MIAHVASAAAECVWEYRSSKKADRQLEKGDVAVRPQDVNVMVDKISAEEWLPRILVPLTFDRASETKIGVFYAKFKTYSSNNDHVVIRLIDSRKSNSTMYSIKLHRVGTVSIFISKLEADSFGELQRNEVRKQSRNNAVNVTDSEFNGFWFTIKNEELTLGLIGDRLIEPIILWNDTLREGPRDVAYFGLTTDQASATFGVNCDVPNLHFPGINFVFQCLGSHFLFLRL